MTEFRHAMVESRARRERRGARVAVEGWHPTTTEWRLAALDLVRGQGLQAGASAACREEPLRDVVRAPKISQPAPGRTTMEACFTVQPNGESGINTCEANFHPGTAAILMDDTALNAAVGHSGMRS